MINLPLKFFIYRRVYDFPVWNERTFFLAIHFGIITYHQTRFCLKSPSELFLHVATMRGSIPTEYHTTYNHVYMYIFTCSVVIYTQINMDYICIFI